MTRTLGPCPNSFRCPLPYSKAGWGVPLCRRRCHHPGLTLTSGKRRRGARAVFGGARGDRDESVSTPPFPTAYLSTATSLRHGKPLLFAGSRVERLSQGSKLLPVCLRVRRDFTVLSAALRPDLDSRWWVPYFFYVWLCFSPRYMFSPDPGHLREGRAGLSLWPRRQCRGRVSPAKQS